MVERMDENESYYGNKCLKPENIVLSKAQSKGHLQLGLVDSTNDCWMYYWALNTTLSALLSTQHYTASSFLDAWRLVMKHKNLCPHEVKEKKQNMLKKKSTYITHTYITCIHIVYLFKI